MMKAVLFSGSAGCGKGEAVGHLDKMAKNSLLGSVCDWTPVMASCKDHLHKLTQTFFGIDAEAYYRIYNSRELKEEPMPAFRISSAGDNIHKLVLAVGGISEERMFEAFECGYIDLSIREAMIYVSECIAKPTFGPDYFGRMRANTLLKYCDQYDDYFDGDNYLILDDSASAFDSGDGIKFDEVEPLKELIGPDNILLFRIERPNNPYSTGDSRKKIPDQEDIKTIDIINEEGKLDDFLARVEKEVSDWLDSNTED